MGSFKDGLHLPYYFKEKTKEKAIVNLKPPARVVIPMSQHTGQPAKPVVGRGDYVLLGQKIGESDGKISVPVHSSVSGKVIDICLWNHPVISKSVLSVVIESDGLDKSIESKKKYTEYYRYSPDELREAIEDAGVVGLGGAAFPTHVKLSPPKDIDVVIVNGCECEPYLTCDDRLLRECALEIIEGLKIIMYMLNSFMGIIAIEDNKSDAINIIKNIILNEPNIELKVVETKYPQGAEKQLIKTVLDREVPPGKLPFDVGVVVQNVGTCIAINNAIKNGLPLTSRVITVTGEYIQQPGNYNVRIGALVNELLDRCGYSFHAFHTDHPAVAKHENEENIQVPQDDEHKIILGGPMMGIAQGTLDVPVIKGTSGIVILPVESDTELDFYPCIRCGKCINSCPMNLMPNMISIYAESQLWEKTKLYYPQDCIECGCCAYVCVAKRPLVQHIKLAKLNTIQR